MIDETPSSAPGLNTSEPSHQERSFLRLETRLATAEAQIRTLQEAVASLNATNRAARQRALYLRIGLLIALLGAFFYLQYAAR